MIVDAHQHFWRLDRGDYAWLKPQLGEIYRDYLPADVAPLIADADVRATVLVQAAATEAETLYLLDLARKYTFIAGVVGWTDFAAVDAAQRIAKLVAAGAGKLKGLRPMIQDIADPLWVLHPRLDAAFAAMLDHGLVFDALVVPSQLSALHARLLHHPQLRVVLDHAGKPDIAQGKFDYWAQNLARLASETGAFCKLSGLMTQLGANGSAKDLAPYVEHVFACFGPERVLWGSDWPVLNLAGDYAQWLELARTLAARYASGHEAAIFGGNATRIYDLEL